MQAEPNLGLLELAQVAIGSIEASLQFRVGRQGQIQFGQSGRQLFA